jgi:DNA-binding IclR family transcriptional regulator
MTHLADNELKVMRVLERHRRLDVLQIASLAELSVSSARGAVESLDQKKLIEETGEVFSLNTRVLSGMLEDSMQEELV